LAELLMTCGDTRPMGVLVTHHHLDHATGSATLARQFAARSGTEVPLCAADQSAVPGSRPLPSTLVAALATAAHVLRRSGHTSASVGVLVDGGRMLTGDSLLCGSSAVIVPDDGGSPGEYVQSLSILRALARDGRIGSIHPGLGVACTSPLAALEAIQ